MTYDEALAILGPEAAAQADAKGRALLPLNSEQVEAVLPLLYGSAAQERVAAARREASGAHS